MAIHLRPLPPAGIIIPVEVLDARHDASRIERVRRHILGIVNCLQIGGGLGNEQAWETTVAGFVQELAVRLAENGETDALDGVVYIANELRAHTRRALDAAQARRQA